ncbi:MAG: NAD(+) synthase [Acidobacteria bacterium]|nr:MAG: NAD(+) synthase [Acidobacteriota bacterium]
MKIALLQINPTVGDLSGNARLIVDALTEAGRLGADLAVTPELALVGYLPRDLLLSPGFIDASWRAAGELASNVASMPPVLVGLPEPNRSDEGRPLFNSAVLLHGGTVDQRFRKALLPTYDVFDEDRYFEPFHGPQILEICGRRLGVSICEDIWNDRDYWKRRRYHHDPIDELARVGATCVINLSASPFTAGKHHRREEMIGSMARKYRVPVVICDIDCARPIAPPADTTPESEIWRALVLGTRDYVRKCGFSSAVLGLSGGIDSALTAAIAVDAVGADRVLGVLMPSPYSSRGSIDDASLLAANLGVRTLTLPIELPMRAFDETLCEPFSTGSCEVARENLQARIRGTLLMALSNTRGALLLTTGNKSQLSVGYCTLYGDMNGGLAVIADVPKTMVYRIAHWRNQTAGRPLIPESSLTKAPSAELRPNQRDQDSLPPYDVLDDILQRHIEQHQPAREIVAAGFDAETVRRVLRLVRLAEFKRKQAAPGLKVTDRAFGTGWRMPIAARVTEGT